MMLKQVTYATILTLIRCILVPFIMHGILHGSWQTVIVLLFIAGITDLFDGFIARYFAQETTLGALLDPVADKALLLGCYSALWYGYGQQAGIPWFFCVIAFIREVCILGGACCMLYYRSHGLGASLSPTAWGKRTTAIQVLFILLLCVRMMYRSVRIACISELLLILVIVSMGISSMQYMRRGLEYQ